MAHYDTFSTYINTKGAKEGRLECGRDMVVLNFTILEEADQAHNQASEMATNTNGKRPMSEQEQEEAPVVTKCAKTGPTLIEELEQVNVRNPNPKPSNNAYVPPKRKLQPIVDQIGTEVNEQHPNTIIPCYNTMSTVL